MTPAITFLDSGGRSYGGRVSAPISVMSAAEPAGPELLHRAQAGQARARYHHSSASHDHLG